MLSQTAQDRQMLSRRLRMELEVLSQSIARVDRRLERLQTELGEEVLARIRTERSQDDLDH